MATASRRRGKNGQLVSAYNDRQLFDAVEEIARFVSAEHPTEVSQRAFDDARALAGHPQAPSARAICARFGRDGKAIGWRILLERACGGGDGNRRAALHRRSIERPDLDQRHLVFALRLASRELETEEGLPPIDYQGWRERRIAACRHRPHEHHDPLLPGLLPTVGQIERIVGHDHDGDHDDEDEDEDVRQSALTRGDNWDDGDEGDDDDHDHRPAASFARSTASEANTSSSSSPDGTAATAGAPAESRKRDAAWDRALELAGLPPRPRTAKPDPTRTPESVPIAVAIHHYLESNGLEAWPSWKRLAKFGELADISIAERSKPWKEHIAEARAYREARGLPCPAAMPKPTGRGAPLPTVKVPKGGIPGAPKRGSRRGRYTREDMIEALRLFDRELPPGQPRTQKAYVAFRRGQNLPAASGFAQHGGFSALTREMRLSHRTADERR
jgi:hypothetical protein